jgi:hypothetical protein
MTRRWHFYRWKKKAANKDAKEMMNRIKELFTALDNEEVLEEETYGESDQEDLDEFSHDEDPDDAFDEDEALTSSLPPDDDVHATTPPAHENKVMVVFVDGLVKEPLHTVDEHIDTFIQIGRCKWDFVISFLIETPFMTLRVPLKKRGLRCHLQKTIFHTYMVHMFRSLMMT